jgi:carboxyl-terminal processing protease
MLRLPLSRRPVVLGITLVVAACISNEATAPVDPHTGAIAYLDSALNLMKTQAYYRRRVDWDSVRANALIQAAGATTPGHTYPAIRQSLLALGDGHSFFRTPLSSPPPSALVPGIGSQGGGVPIDSLHAQILDAKYALLHVPSFSGSNTTLLADTLQALIKALDTSNPCAWIVDLRRNRGGNMWPMLAGVGPILGNDLHVGAFINADSVESRWYYENGSAGIINTAGTRSLIVSTSRVPYVTKLAGQPVAVLTDSLTASSGEAMVIAFRGLARARSFGGATAGVPTANAGFFMPDGAMVFLTVAIDADRNGTWYDTRIAADEPIFLPTFPTTADTVVAAAKAWLAGRPGCS